MEILRSFVVCEKCTQKRARKKKRRDACTGVPADQAPQRQRSEIQVHS